MQVTTSNRHTRGDTILVVDDERSARVGTADLLRRRKYRVKVANSAYAAVKKADLIGPELGIVVLDIRMDGAQDGIDAAREIQLRHPGIRKVFLTAFSDDREYRRRAEEYGLEIDEWIAKPVAGPAKQLLVSTISRLKEQIRASNFAWISASYGLDPLEAVSLAKELSDILNTTRGSAELDQLTRSFSVARTDQIVSRLASSLNRLRAGYCDLPTRQLAFEELRKVTLGPLWQVFEIKDKPHRQVAMLARTSVRQLSALNLTLEQLAAIEELFHLLCSETISSDDVYKATIGLRGCGIETLAMLGERVDQLLQIYDDYDAEDNEE
jgi:CheY-like chemotaxis protein